MAASSQLGGWNDNFIPNLAACRTKARVMVCMTGQGYGIDSAGHCIRTYNHRLAGRKMFFSYLDAFWSLVLSVLENFSGDRRTLLRISWFTLS